MGAPSAQAQTPGSVGDALEIQGLFPATPKGYFTK